MIKKKKKKKKKTCRVSTTFRFDGSVFLLFIIVSMLYVNLSSLQKKKRGYRGILMSFLDVRNVEKNAVFCRVLLIKQMYRLSYK